MKILLQFLIIFTFTTTVNAETLLGFPEILMIGNATEESFNQKNIKFEKIIAKEASVSLNSYNDVGFCSKKGMTSGELKRLIKYGNSECPYLYEAIAQAKVITLSTSGTEFISLMNNNNFPTLFKKSKSIKIRYMANINEIISNIREINNGAVILVPKMHNPLTLNNKYNLIINNYIQGWNDSLTQIVSKESNVFLYDNFTLKTININKKLK